MRIKTLILLVHVIFITQVSGQTVEDTIPAASSKLEELNIRERLDASRDMLLYVSDFWKDHSEGQARREEADQIRDIVIPLMTDSTMLRDTVVSAWELDRWIEDITQIRTLISDYSEKVDTEVDTLRAIYSRLEKEEQLWKESNLVDRTDSAVWEIWSPQIVEIRTELHQASERILDTINRLSAFETELYQLVQGLNQSENELDGLIESDEYHVIRNDLPALWSAESKEVGRYKLVGGWSIWLKEIRVFLNFNEYFFWRWGGLTFLIFVLIFGAKQYSERHYWLRKPQRFKVLNAWMAVPLATAFVLAFVINRYILFDGLADTISRPSILTKLESMLGYIALIFAAWRPSVKRLRRFLLYPLILFVIDGLIISIYGASFNGRVALILEHLVFATVLVLIFRKLSRTHSIRKRRWFGTVVLLSSFVIIAQVMAAVTVASGNFSLSRILAYSTYYVLGNGMILYFVNLSIPGLLQAFVASPFGKRTHVIREFIGGNLRILTMLIQYYLIVIFLVGLANQLSFGKEIMKVLTAIWEFSFSPGDTFTIAVSGIVEFLIVLGVVYFVAQFLQVIVRDEIASRLTHKKGLPLAYGVITKYIVFTIGFFASVSVLGIPIGKLSFALGALGVGIGFGLQALVGNFIAGIVILFERPLRIGDVIKVGDKEGEVQEIGARAVRIRLWEGAEEIIPNYDIVTKSVTNWTLSDQLRRREAVFYVKPEAPVNEVLDILESATRDVEEIVEDPAPIIQFMGIQGSAATYRCLFWVNRDYLRKDSEYKSDVYLKLSEKDWNMSSVRWEKRGD